MMVVNQELIFSPAIVITQDIANVCVRSSLFAAMHVSLASVNGYCYFSFFSLPEFSYV